MRKKIEIELMETEKRLKDIQKEIADNDERGVERYMFFMSMGQLLDGNRQKISDLKEKLEKLPVSCPKAL